MKSNNNDYYASRDKYFDDAYVNEQKYYEKNPSHMPEVCKACGGPYPGCAPSCPMFDD